MPDPVPIAHPPRLLTIIAGNNDPARVLLGGRVPRAILDQEIRLQARSANGVYIVPPRV